MVHHPLLAGIGAVFALAVAVPYARAQRLPSAPTADALAAPLALALACEQLGALFSGVGLWDRDYCALGGRLHPSSCIALERRTAVRSGSSRAGLCRMWRFLPLPSALLLDAASAPSGRSRRHRSLLAFGAAIYFTEFWRDPEGRGSLFSGALDGPQLAAIVLVLMRRACSLDSAKSPASLRRVIVRTRPAEVPHELKHARLLVPPEAAGQRLDHFLATQLEGSQPLAGSVAPRTGRRAAEWHAAQGLAQAARRRTDRHHRRAASRAAQGHGGRHPSRRGLRRRRPCRHQQAGGHDGACRLRSERRCAQPWHAGQRTAASLSRSLVHGRRPSSRHRASARQGHQRPDHRGQERRCPRGARRNCFQAVKSAKPTLRWFTARSRAKTRAPSAAPWVATPSAAPA